LLGDDRELDSGFAEALTGAACGGPFEQARTELLYGDRLLGAGRAEEASSAYTQSLERFEHLGAEPWATRARAGIVGAGYVPAPARPRIIARLSARELEVAIACAEGGSPRAVAERLFLGVRTVELHLASAKIKLGLNSTAEFADALRSDTGLAMPQPT
jgi:DNA-binding NarL/FixJ family response regulator